MDMKAPENLGEAGKRFWTLAIGEREFTEAHDVERLAIAAACVDEMQADEAILRREGRFRRHRLGHIVAHPAIKTLTETRITFLRVVHSLGLDLATDTDGQQKLF